MFSQLGTRHEHRGPGLSERQQGAAALHRHRRRQMGRSQAPSLDDGVHASYRIEARIYARYILKSLPNAKIAVLYQNDDFGKDYIIGLRQGLGDKADKMIVAIKKLRDHRPDRQFADRGAARQRRRHAADGGGPEICRAGDPQGLRHRLEADALRRLPVEFDRRRDETGGAGKERRHHFRHGISRTAPTRNGRTPRNGRTGRRGCKKYNAAGNLGDPFNVDGYSAAKRWSRCSRRAATISPART